MNKKNEILELNEQTEKNLDKRIEKKCYRGLFLSIIFTEVQLFHQGNKNYDFLFPFPVKQLFQKGVLLFKKRIFFLEEQSLSVKG